jgi:hypothetical protein
VLGHDHVPSLNELRVRHFEFGSELLDEFTGNIKFEFDHHSNQRLDTTIKFIEPERLDTRSEALGAWVSLEAAKKLKTEIQ